MPMSLPLLHLQGARFHHASRPTSMLELNQSLCLVVDAALQSDWCPCVPTPQLATSLYLMPSNIPPLDSKSSDTSAVLYRRQG